MECALCAKSIDQLNDSFVTFARCSEKSAGCSHYAHLMCANQSERYTCPVCNEGAAEIDFGLKLSDARFSAYKAMTREVEESAGVFSAWSGSSAIKQTLSKYPNETLKANTLLQLLDANVSCADLLVGCSAAALTKKFSTSELLDLRPTSSDLSKLLAAGAEFDAMTISAICPTADDLISLNLEPADYVSRGFRLEQFISRGTTLKQLLALEDGESSFSEFVGTWGPTARHLAQLHAFSAETLAETSWCEATVKSYGAARQRKAAPPPSVRAMCVGEAAALKMKKNIKFSF